MGSGYVTLVVELELTHADDVSNASVTAERQPDQGPAQPAPPGPPGYAWNRSWHPWATGVTWGLERVAGDDTRSVWRGAETVTRAAAGSFVVTSVTTSRSDPADGGDVVTPVAGPRVVVAPDSTWRIAPLAEPVKVVTGDERFTPSARVTDSATGAPGAGARIAQHRTDMGYVDSCHTPGFECPTTFAARLATSPPDGATDAAGVWTSPRSLDVVEEGTYAYHVDVAAYGGRGSRGFSLEATGVTGPGVKRQANARYSATRLAPGGTLVVEGNAWPAPSVFPAAGQRPPVHLQLLESGAWRTVATSGVRSNGRYSLQWTPTDGGTHQLRVRIPGGTTTYGAPVVGTNLAGVAVTVR